MTIVLDGSSGITAPGGTAAAPSITTTGDTNTGIFFPAADTIAFSEGGVEAARFDSSGNLGLGVTPSAWSGVGAALQVGTSAAIIGNSVSSSSFISNAYFDGTNYRYIGTGFAMRLALTSGAYAFTTAASGTAGNTISFTQAMTLAANGNLLVGTTTDKGYRVLVSGADADDDPVLGSATGAFHVSNSDVTYGMDFGVSSDGKGWIQQQSNTGAATAYDLSLQPVGGNVGIGTASPNTGLVPGLVIGNGTDNKGITLFGTATTQQNIAFTDTANAQQGLIQYDHTSDYMRFFTSSNERARIDSPGNVGIGTTSPTAKLQVETADGVEQFRLRRASTNVWGSLSQSSESNALGLAFNANDGNANTPGFVWRTGTDGSTYTERMRLTTTALLVGKTAADATVVGGEIRTNGRIFSTLSTNNGTDTFTLHSTAAGGYQFYVLDTGQIYARFTSIIAISDQRLKENICDLDVGLDAVMALKPRKFDWKKGQGQDKKNVRGFVAQEYEEVFPDLVYSWKDPAPQGEEPYKAISQDLIPVLVKAIQELTARVAALEGNN